MLQSFIVYGLLALIMFAFGRLANQRDKIRRCNGRSSIFWTWEIVVLLSIFTFVAGVRWNVGVDHHNYLNNYLLYQNTGSFVYNKEIGFQAITQLMAGLDLHYAFYFSFFAFIQILFLYLAFKDEKYLYPYFGIIIVLGPHFLSWMNGMRQMVVAAAFVYSIKFIIQRNFLAYASVIGLASFMHASAIILLPIYFIPQKDYFKSRWLLFLLSGVTFYLGESAFWIGIMSDMGGVLNLIGYDNYADRLSDLINSEEIRNIGPRRIIITAAALLAIWLSPKLKVYFKETKFLFCFNMAIAGFLLYNIFGNAHHIFIRPISYLTIFSIPVSAYVLVYLGKARNGNFVPFFLALILMSLYTPGAIVADYGKGSEDYSNYRFFWDK